MTRIIGPINPYLVQSTPNPYTLIVESLAAGAFAGTLTAGGWRTRTLNTEVIDIGNNASVGSNQIILQPGTYRFRVSAPAFQVDRHQVRLWDVTNGSSRGNGSSEISYNSDTVQSRSIASGRFTIDVATTFELQHYCQTTKTDYGMGIDSQAAMPAAIYAIAEFWKEVVNLSIPSSKYICIAEKTPGTSAGTFTAGAWRTRSLNYIVSDVSGYVMALTNGRFTLPPGTYIFSASAPAFQVDRHQVRLYNITDAAVVQNGTSEISYNGDTVQSRSFAMGRFVITASKDFELQHYCQTTVATQGLGTANGFTGDDERFSMIELWKDG